MYSNFRFLSIAERLELAGLIWQPEIGDEIALKEEKERISILVDPQGMTPTELRSVYLWLPSIEQLVLQVEMRQSILFHLGLELSEASMVYKTVIQSPLGPIEACGDSPRVAVGEGLHELLVAKGTRDLH